MRDKKEGKSAPVLPVYESRPPVWLPKLHGTADLGEHCVKFIVFEAILNSLQGYIGFHPPRTGQDEDGLSESNIKNGFVLPHPVPVGVQSSIRD